MAAFFRTTLTQGQLLVTLSFTYPMGTNDLTVSINGKLLILGKEYSELSSSQIVLSAPAAAGDILEARVS